MSLYALRKLVNKIWAIGEGYQKEFIFRIRHLE